MLERGHEREADRLARLGYVRRVVRERLDPRDLGQRVQIGSDRLLGGTEIHRSSPALAPVQQVEANVGRDAVEPGAQLGAAFEAIDALPRAQERFLDSILCLERRAEHSVAVGGQLPAMLLELAERRRDGER